MGQEILQKDKHGSFSFKFATDYYAYIYEGGDLWVLDIRPSQIYVMPVGKYDLPGEIYDVFLEDGYAYVTSGSYGRHYGDIALAAFDGNLGYRLPCLIRNAGRFKEPAGSNDEERKASLKKMFGLASWHNIIGRTV